VAKRKPPPNPELGRRLIAAMKAHPDRQLRKQTQLANRAGVSQSTISRMQRGEVDPQSGTVHSVFGALGISSDPPSDGDPGGLLDTAPGPGKAIRRVPLISQVQAGGWGESADPYQPGVGQKWLQCPVPCGENAFALKVEGASMEPRYHNGDVVFVDPSVSPTQGSDVVVREENNRGANFKQLTVEGSRRWLKPRNPQFPSIEMPADARMVGVVIGAAWATTPAAGP
jgi:SOS-response transcriptional repressor LexA